MNARASAGRFCRVRAPDAARLNRGDRPGKHWVPAECDVSIRPGWFYHRHEDDQVMTPQALVDLYYSSVGRGASFLLNLPPDRRGRIHDNDVRSLREFRRTLDATFATNLAAGARVHASNVRDPQFAAENVLDGNRDTYWTTNDRVLTPILTFDFGRPISFNVIRIREYLPLGQRVESIKVDMWRGREPASATAGWCAVRGLRLHECDCELPKLRYVQQFLRWDYSLSLNAAGRPLHHRRRSTDRRRRRTNSRRRKCVHHQTTVHCRTTVLRRTIRDRPTIYRPPRHRTNGQTVLRGSRHSSRATRSAFRCPSRVAGRVAARVYAARRSGAPPR